MGWHDLQLRRVYAARGRIAQKEGTMSNFARIAPTLVLNLDAVTVMHVEEPLEPDASPRVTVWWRGESDPSTYVGTDARKLAAFVARQRDIEEI